MLPSWFPHGCASSLWLVDLSIVICGQDLDSVRYPLRNGVATEHPTQDFVQSVAGSAEMTGPPPGALSRRPAFPALNNPLKIVPDNSDPVCDKHKKRVRPVRWRVPRIGEGCRSFHLLVALADRSNSNAIGF